MTNEATVQNGQEPLTEEQQREAEAAFADGFKKVSGDAQQHGEGTTTTNGAAPAGEQPAGAQTPEKQDAAATPAASDQDPWSGVPSIVRERIQQLEALPGRLRNIEGHFGGLNSKLDKVLATAKADTSEAGSQTPTDKQAKSALQDPEQWRKMKEDFPEWAEAIEARLSAMRDELGGGKAGTVVQAETINRDEIIAEAEERAFVRVKYPDWKQTVATPQFLAFALEGGPTAEAYQQMKALERIDPAQADAMLNGFMRDYPKWWADRGNLMFGSTASHAVQLLDAYSEQFKRSANADSVRQRNQSRLSRGVVPTSTTSGIVSTGVSDEQAFERGFKRVAGSG